MNPNVHIPDAQERKIAESVLGAQATYHPVVCTRHPVTRWEAKGRVIATKHYQTDRAYQTELRVFAHMKEAQCRFVPHLLAHGKSVIAMSWIPGEHFIDCFDPFALVESMDTFLEAAEAIASFHAAGSAIAKETLEDTTSNYIPGPCGFVHGDTLPHNMSITPDGHMFLLDFENCSWGHCLLDLAPLACVMHSDTREQMLDRYCNVRQWNCTPEIVQAYREITHTWPRVFINRLKEPSITQNFQHVPERRTKLETWCRAGIAATA